MPKAKRAPTKKQTQSKKVAASRTRSRKTTPGVAKHHSWNSVEVEALNPLLQRQMVVGKGVMVARILLKKGCAVPMHHHHNEQVSCILEGALRFEIGGEEIIVRGGDVLTIPPHLPHSAVAVEDTVALDVFNPPRMDWIKKTDGYLRGTE